MDIDRDKMLAKAARLLAMAERGEGGERDNARRMLGELLDKHGLTLDELDDNQPKWWRCDIKTQDEAIVLYNSILATFPEEVLSPELHTGGKPYLCLYGLRGGQLASASVLAERVLDAFRATKAAMQARHRKERSAELAAKAKADKRRKCERKMMLAAFLNSNRLTPRREVFESKGQDAKMQLDGDDLGAMCRMLHEAEAVDRTDRLTAGHNQLPQ